MKPDSVIFDMDGTLLDTLGDIMNSVNAVLQENGHHPRGLEAFRRGVGWGVEHLVRSLLDPASVTGSDVARIGDQVQEHYENISHSVTEPYPGVMEMLREIQFAGVPMAVLTNKPQRAAELTAMEFFPRIVFHEVRGSQPGEPAKPDPEAAISVSRIMGSSPGMTMLVGDSEVDILTGRNAGMITVGVEWGFRGRPELVAAGADTILGTPADVASLVLTGSV